MIFSTFRPDGLARSSFFFATVHSELCWKTVLAAKAYLGFQSLIYWHGDGCSGYISVGQHYSSGYILAVMVVVDILGLVNIMVLDILGQ